VLGGWESVNMWGFFLWKWVVVRIGLFGGVLIGMVAGGVTEVLKVLGIVGKGMGMGEGILIVLMGIVLGKIVGWMLEWVIFVDL
ncbi:stage V sporulation protein AB, partial [Bacillus licheniformis]|uniref:stage V sporulation protein AB n=1 Tax=Bacillus licheniformis TaxID=1402 RepID=UPI001642448E